MKPTFTIFLFVALLSPISNYGQNMLQVYNPNIPWLGSGQQGTIEEAIFTVKPQGAYMDVSMILTLSDQGTNFWENLLEIVLDFNLPEGSIVYDSWLWMLDDSTIVRADILDIWTGTQIYEDIVDRQMDPSLLYQKENGSYQIRIFPLENGSSRKIKISYLVPAIWEEETVQTWLPFDILSTSANPLNFIQLITFPDDNFTVPAIEGAPNITFSSVIDPQYGEILTTMLPSSLFNKPIRFKTDSPLATDDVFVQTYSNGSGTDNFYQAIYNPPVSNNTGDSKNILFLLDHLNYNTSYHSEDIIAELKTNCHKYLTGVDNWNVLYSTPNGTEELSNTWLAGAPHVLSNNLSLLPPSLLEASDLNNLLLDGLDFIRNNGEPAEIIVLCNSGDLWNNSVNTLLDQIDTMDVIVHIINYQTEGFYSLWGWDWDSNYWSYNNKEAYTNLTLNTGGYLYGSLEGTSNLWANFSSLLSKITEDPYPFSFQTSFDNGFTYQQYSVGYFGQSQNKNQPIIEVGKYYGNGSMEIDYSTLGNTGMINDFLLVDSSAIITGDSLSEEIWVGHKIREMESNAVSSNNISDVINLSIEERVLSKYTAFLAVDLSQGAEPCINCWDFTPQLVKTEDIEEEQSLIQISTYPNPFFDHCIVSFEIPEGEQISLSNLEIVDHLGRIVYTQKFNTIDGPFFQFEWDGTNNMGEKLPSGLYHMILKTEKGIFSSSVTLMAP